MRGGSLVAGSCGNMAGRGMSRGVLVAKSIRSVELGQDAPHAKARIYTARVRKNEKDAVAALGGVLFVDRRFAGPIDEFMRWAMGARLDVLGAAERGGLLAPLKKIDISGLDSTKIRKERARLAKIGAQAAEMGRAAGAVSSDVAGKFAVPRGDICRRLDVLAQSLGIEKGVLYCEKA